MADEERQIDHAEARSRGEDEAAQPVAPVRDPDMLTIEEVARVLDCTVEVAQTIHQRGILPHDDVQFTEEPEPKPIFFWRRSRVEWHKKLRDAEVKELADRQAAQPEKKPLKKRSR